MTGDRGDSRRLTGHRGAAGESAAQESAAQELAADERAERRLFGKGAVALAFTLVVVWVRQRYLT